ncbi:dienelactone hydrolase [Altererythrobacter atlanticus]|uniref:Alpha/beta hydrolase fold protein n=1 Tax=Croceibacterium atlanticum TaxID=1267766 RepID=A0A0F7KT43_9SPHN|nr:alpha/beta hydrolase fold domain-containing protein [Croceibacterium atlanticum]AKH41955.1 alpha/beta hydrolase fold protein [Croceibacterium atlanticum]MBB5733477.1 dienelactone hydrolase [Croceibacterium atlanticum]
MFSKGVMQFRKAIAGAALLAVLCPQAAYAHPVRGELYDGAAPGSETWSEARVVLEDGERRAVYNTTQPVYELHLPRPERASGAGVVMLPGGGLRMLGTGGDLHDEVDALVAEGVAVMVLEYRTLQMAPGDIERSRAPRPGNAPPPKFPKMEIRQGNANPSPDDPVLAEVLRLATLDARTALQLMHDKAAEWNLDPDRIGAMGTSAGGGVAFGALLADAPVEEKPDYLISIYGPSLQDIHSPAGDAPPLFLVTEADHGPVTDGLIDAFRIWKDAGHKAELHVYEVPNFSMTVDLWGARLFDWMRERGILDPGN